MTVTVGTLLRQPNGAPLLSHVLGISKTHLYAYPERVLSEEEWAKFHPLLQACDAGTPLAYITGSAEFWSLPFKVTQDTLIPRPETEIIVEYILNNKDEKLTIADLGTGAGPIALALAKNLPLATVIATDVCPDALLVAKENAKNLHIPNVQFYEGSWVEALPALLFDYIVSNPPYVGIEDPHLEASVKAFEPHKALFAGDNGLAALSHIVEFSKPFLKPNGCLILEHGFQQGAKIRKIFEELGYTRIQTLRDLNQLERVTLGHVAIATRSSF